MTSATAPITFWQGKLSIASSFDEDTIDSYTSGDCYILARVLHELGLGELVVVTDGADRWSHMAVRTPEGYILDVEGINDPSITLTNYGQSYSNGGLIEALDLATYERLTDDQAQSIVTSEEVLKAAKSLQAMVECLPELPALDS